LNYTVEAIANWAVTKRLTFSPEIFYQAQSINNYFIAGNEFRYNVSRNVTRTNPTSVFVSGCYQSNDIVAVGAGVEFKRFRLGLSYNYNIGALNNASNGQGGCSVSLRYIAPGRKQGSQNRTTAKSSF